MLALCLMLLATYYVLNYAGIIGRGLLAAEASQWCPNAELAFFTLTLFGTDNVGKFSGTSKMKWF